MLSVLLNVAKKYYQDHPREFCLVATILFVAGILEGLGFATVLPILQLLIDSNVSDTEDFTVLERVVYFLLNKLGITLQLHNLLGLALCIFTFKAVILYFAMRLVSNAVAIINADFRARLIRAVLKADWSFFLNTPSGTIANATTMEGNAAATGYWTFSNIAAQGLSVLIYLIIAAMLSPYMTAGSIIAGLLLLFLLRGIITRSRAASVTAVKAYNTLSSTIVDGMAGFKPIKVMALEHWFQRLLLESSLQLKFAQRKIVLNKEILAIAQELITIALSLVVIFCLAKYAESKFEEILLLAILFQRSISKLARVQSFYNRLGISEAHRISLEKKVSEATSMEDIITRGIPVQFGNKITLETVSFSYESNDVIKKLSGHIRFGSITLITGASGSGKTTLTDLLAGLQTPNHGQIFVDNVPFSKLDKLAWRRQIGYVQQDHFLFQDTIHNNVTLGDETLSQEDVKTALKQAEAWSFISNLPGNILSQVGAGGGLLSGGQRQRIALARALVRKPKLLILDEPTTALDPDTEKEICRTLQQLSRKMAILIVSHQDSIRNIADEVFELRDGSLFNPKTQMLAK